MIGIENINEITGFESISYINELKLKGNKLSQKIIEQFGGLDSKGIALDPNKYLDYVRLMKEITSIRSQRKKFLRSLFLPNRGIEDMSFLILLKRYDLKSIELFNNKIKEITDLESFTNLKRLDLNKNQITELKGLETLTKLEELRIGQNQIKEIKGMENLSKLKVLEIGGNDIDPDLILKLGAKFNFNPKLIIFIITSYASE